MVGTSRKLFRHEQKLVLGEMPSTERACHQKEVEKERKQAVGGGNQRCEAVHIDIK